MDYSLPVSSVCGISQARILEWVDILFSRNLPHPEVEPMSPLLANVFLFFFYRLSHQGSPDKEIPLTI